MNWVAVVPAMNRWAIFGRPWRDLMRFWPVSARFESHDTSPLIPLPIRCGEGGIGSWVLLQPERIHAYAQAVIRTLREDELQCGWLMEERVLKGDLAYESAMPGFAGGEEWFVLVAMRRTLVERGFPSPGGRKTIAQRFIAGFPRAREISPVRDERRGSHFG